MSQEIDKALKEMSSNVNDIIKLMDDLEYSVFRNDSKNFNLNIVGVRHPNIEVNKFKDTIHVFWWYKKSFNHVAIPSSTLAGLHWLTKPINPKGCAILKAGQYKSTWAIDLHRNKYRALCQRLKPVDVYRDADQDREFDFIEGSVENGMFGINIHRCSTEKEVKRIDKYSAGCQIIPNPNDWKLFLNLCDLSVQNGFKNSFTYTLLKQEWI